MMAIYRHIAMLAAVALLCCCNGEDTLLDLYPMEPIVNPEVGILLGGNGIIHVDLDGRYQISGVADVGIFTTTDRFKSLDFESRVWQATDGLVAFGNGVIVHAQPEGTSFVLRYTMDSGKTWATYGEISMVPVQLLVAADRSVWVLCQRGAGEEGGAILYRLDLEHEQCTLLMERVGASALAFGFVDSEQSWVLCDMPAQGIGRVQVLRTEDGGRTWSNGAVLDVFRDVAVTPITTDDLLVYDGEGAAIRSTDGGISFEQVVLGGPIVACQAASSDVVYALLENGIAKSSDGGRSWTVLDAVVHGVGVSGTALDFHDERTGIVYGADRIFVTANGGQSWDVLVYPYDYVFE